MSDSFFSGDGFISIFFLLFIVAFVAILGMILVTFVRGRLTFQGIRYLDFQRM